MIRPVDVLTVLVLAAMFVLAGTGVWWMLPLAVAAALVGCRAGGVRLGVLALACAAAGAAFALLLDAATLREVLVGMARGVCVGVLPWLLTVAWRTRREAELREATALVREQEAHRDRVEARLAHERLRLAEDLHDDLGHALSLVALNLGRLELDPAMGAPAREAVGLARAQVAEAVGRLGASVEALRDGPAPGTLGEPGPVAEVPDVESLVEAARRAGADVTLTGRLPSAGRTAPVARVVREGLTNALRHAPGSPVTVSVEAHGEGGTTVVVRNPVPAPTGNEPRGDAARGTGLRSLGAHVSAVGGTLTAGPEDGAFVVRARLPVAPVREAGPRPPSGGPPPPHDGPAPPEASPGEPRLGSSPDDAVRRLVRARRRGGVLLAAAVVVPTAALALVASALALADVQTARRAQLDPGSFARIQVGDDRSDVAPLLPEATLPAPAGADPSCDHYAVTADPLADASGDAYRICWEGDTVASTDVVIGGAP